MQSARERAQGMHLNYPTLAGLIAVIRLINAILYLQMVKERCISFTSTLENRVIKQTR